MSLNIKGYHVTIFQIFITTNISSSDLPISVLIAASSRPQPQAVLNQVVMHCSKFSVDAPGYHNQTPLRIETNYI